MENYLMAAKKQGGFNKANIIELKLDGKICKKQGKKYSVEYNIERRIGSE